MDDVSPKLSVNVKNETSCSSSVSKTKLSRKRNEASTSLNEMDLENISSVSLKDIEGWLMTSIKN